MADAPLIRVTHDGPYALEGVEDVRDHLGRSIDVPAGARLCRCGGSQNKPFCDGTHAKNGFSGEKDPKRLPDRRDEYDGVALSVLDNRAICQHSGYCTDRLASVFHSTSEPFVTPSAGRLDDIARAVRACPSGALSYAVDGREQRESVDFNGTRPPSIEVSLDGPYRVTGGIELVEDDGTPVARNAGASLEHYALCRCGRSQNKPFCSGAHWYADFHDPAPPAEPSVFEWAGGFPALRAMAHVFYEKYVAQDPLLAPLFGQMAPDHPDRVAAWLGEVFGGPATYSENFGGYKRMLSQHIGKSLTEEKRARWVELLVKSANDVGLPNDAEFRAAFVSYLEWGTRLAVENSQPGATPPQNMPMPHWSWAEKTTPGSRPSANPSTQQAPPPAVSDLRADETPSFERHVKPLFREFDRKSMKAAFDLWEYESVKAHAAKILKALQGGSMPCDGPWPPEKVAVLARWIDAEMPP